MVGSWTTLAHLIAVLFALTGFVSIVGYLPQLYTLLRSTGRSIAVSIHTWIIWTADSVIALLYGIFELQDTLYIAIVTFDVFGSGGILALTIYNRFFRFKNQPCPAAAE